MGYWKKIMLGSQDRECLTQFGSLLVDRSSKEQEKCLLVSSNIRSPQNSMWVKQLEENQGWQALEAN